MGELIKITREESKPRIQCPLCGKIQELDLSIFERDVSKIYRDNCIQCGGELHVAIMILVHPRLNGILQCISRVIKELNPKTFLKT